MSAKQTTAVDRFAVSGIELESIRGGDAVITSTKWGSRAICGVCGEMTAVYATSDEAWEATEEFECFDPGRPWDH